ncbi:transcription-repair-coupling factor [Thalassobaculum fulvum]|uniref:Transcription-repair-coupling factor n=1 Tax=Thalassobaculum fulvum TaxID=1633335 RepID=A0A919CPA2_9PROT|nr:transcription-repair coupling factor [Thalassobaculum fulvum]GHD47816.1 transcription-repair-coupling factor [Thalassobaculum fulvum]
MTMDLSSFPAAVGRVTIASAPEGLDAVALVRLARDRGRVLHVARDDARLAALARTIGFVDPALAVLSFPAWDCLPYDRVSPNGEILSRRVETLAELSAMEAGDGPLVVLTTVNAVLQRVPPRRYFEGASLTLKVGQEMPLDDLLAVFTRSGYGRTDTVREPGEYAVRGGIVDVFPTGMDEPVRLDFFGDELEAARPFDAMTQRTSGKLDRVVFRPVGETLLDDQSIHRFRTGYRALFGAEVASDPVYEAVSAGHRHGGMEHWLPLFHDGMATLLDYVGEVAVTLDHQVDEVATARFEQIAEYYDARRQMLRAGGAESGGIYRPLPADALYLGPDEWTALLADRPVGALTPFAAPPGAAVIDLGAAGGVDFAEARTRGGSAVYDAARDAIAAEVTAGRRVVVAGYSEGSRDRLASLLRDHGVEPIEPVDSMAATEALPRSTVAAAVLPLERGWRHDNLTVIAEPDLVGERMARPSSRRRRRGEEFLQEVGALEAGDYVVHAEHGIGQYLGLDTLEIGGAPHDCLRLVYAGGDKLFVPVENIEILSRYGSEDSNAQLDKLGGAAWQARKARVKKRLRDMAEGLIAIAAERELRRTEALYPPAGVYDEFCARFPYTETDDQLKAIDEVLGDLASGRPMDRLVCGDVGFGKTEVALRAALVVAMQGYQVAVVVPTTLLCRQHFRGFKERFQGLPIRIEQLSRLVSNKEAAEIRKGIAAGDVNLVVGTHAVLSKQINFNNLGLLIVDEEQHFGVAQKERLKDLRKDVHVLTMTATPIPRTLQMALSGVRELSLIATPPVDRLAVRTFVMPYDGVIIREAILRERYRGGKTFYVCPRVEDLSRVHDRLTKLVPEAKIGVAHGRMGATELEDVMTAFTDGGYDILLSTNIVESGLDIPSANTIVIHRADMFGLAQLYQLRGRVGRSKTRAYGYLTTHPSKVLTPVAKRRLEVMQTLDNLGAGFSLASHDMDIRGAGNLLGEEQSGHVKEVGIELYQELLREAVEAAKSGEGLEVEESGWTPQIAIGMPVMIPEAYVPDLSVRMSLYRRIATLSDEGEIDAFAAELVDRFGKLPAEVENLLKIVAIKRLCRAAGVEKVDAGPKGATLAFRNNDFKNPAGLVAFMQKQAGTVQLRPDHRMVYRRPWDKPEQRVVGLTRLMQELVAIAA